MGSKNAGSRRAAAGYKTAEKRLNRRVGKADLRHFMQKAAAGELNDDDHEQDNGQQQMQAGFSPRPGSDSGR